uniref:SUN domain-containing protein n=1 Tax=Leptobrachium leishanense TaxID=445787 RepID=A0A8C5QCD7_9ANUR
MDYSHLHTYAPPQCLPENTGYTYSLSSSYSSAALEFESLHKLDPVFDSPRMSRRSLRLSHTVNNTSDLHNDSVASNSSVRQVLNSSRQSSSSSHHSTQRKSLSNSSFLSHSSVDSHGGDTSAMSSILDESLIREQTAVDHLWGKSGDTTVVQTNGELNSAQTQTTMINGYTCNDCSMLSDRNNVLTTFSASPATSTNQHTSSIVFSRNRSQKQSSKSSVLQTTARYSLHLCLCGSNWSPLFVFYLLDPPSVIYKTALLVRMSARSLAALTVKLFHILLTLGYESKAHSNYCGSLNVQNYLKEDGHLRINGESLCDDCKGTKHHETHTTVLTHSSRAKRVTASVFHLFSYAGYFLQRTVQSVAAAGWFVSRKVLSFLWLAIVSPGKAASGIFWWLGTGWYQLSTLISLLNVFLLTRCLPKMRKLLFLLIPLLLLLGLWFWGIGNLWSLLPAFTGLRTQSGKAAEDPVTSFKPTPDIRVPISNKQENGSIFFPQVCKNDEKQLALLASNHSYQVKDHDKLVLLVQQIQEQVTKDGDQSQMYTLISSIVSEHLARSAAEKPEKSTVKKFTLSIDADYKARILHLETLLGRFGGNYEDQDVLRRRIQSLEQEFATYKAELLKEKAARASCEHADCVLQKVDAKVRESLQMMFASQENLPESFKQWLSATYLSKADFNGILQELELRILKNISHHVSVTKHAPTAAVVEQAVTAGISGITKQEAHVIVSNALKLYSQDRTGMVDFALESGGGSILGTRCSETFETKTALLSLFGIPLWYFSQSPRVVIQPDMYPGNCWAFKGAEGYLVIRLSMMIYPTSFSLEHIPKSLSPTGNITSAPKDFAVYGLDDEYQEEGTLLAQSVYNQDGDPLQIFQSTEENKKPFQIVELRVYSNWGHADYTCIYRFRVHGTPAK